VSPGDNQPLTSEHIDRVFSSQEIDGWANQIGVAPDQMRSVLAQALPHVVDFLTPQGQVPSQTPDIGAMIRQFIR
jgi:uncharacterized protein YidB (DUF937 family)